MPVAAIVGRAGNSDLAGVGVPTPPSTKTKTYIDWIQLHITGVTAADWWYKLYMRATGGSGISLDCAFANSASASMCMYNPPTTAYLVRHATFGSTFPGGGLCVGNNGLSASLFAVTQNTVNAGVDVYIGYHYE